MMLELEPVLNPVKMYEAHLHWREMFQTGREAAAIIFTDYAFISCFPTWLASTDV
jgi:hypothetical protein